MKTYIIFLENAHNQNCLKKIMRKIGLPICLPSNIPFFFVTQRSLKSGDNTYHDTKRHMKTNAR